MTDSLQRNEGVGLPCPTGRETRLGRLTTPRLTDEPDEWRDAEDERLTAEQHEPRERTP